MNFRVCGDCGAEYRPEIAVCSDCGGALEDRYEDESGESLTSTEKPPPPPLNAAAPDLRPLFCSSTAADLEPKALLRELRAAGGDLKALRLALTGRATGPELSAILAALPKEEALRRVDQALQHAQP